MEAVDRSSDATETGTIISGWSASPFEHDRAASDEELWRHVQANDADAFELVFDRHWTSAMAITRLYSPDPEASAQEGFLAAWRGRMQFSPDSGSLRSWLLRIMRNRAIDDRRKREPSPHELEGLASDAPEPPLPDQAAVDKDEGARAREALAVLPREQREPLALAFYGGLSHREIASALNEPLGTVKSRVRLGLDRLRQGLGVQHFDQTLSGAGVMAPNARNPKAPNPGQEATS